MGAIVKPLLRKSGKRPGTLGGLPTYLQGNSTLRTPSHPILMSLFLDQSANIPSRMAQIQPFSRGETNYQHSHYTRLKSHPSAIAGHPGRAYTGADYSPIVTPTGPDLAVTFAPTHSTYELTTFRHDAMPPHRLQAPTMAQIHAFLWYSAIHQHNRYTRLKSRLNAILGHPGRAYTGADYSPIVTLAISSQGVTFALLGGAVPTQIVTMHTNLDASSFSDLHTAPPNFALAPALQALPFFRPVMPLHITLTRKPSLLISVIKPLHKLDEARSLHTLFLRLPDRVPSVFNRWPRASQLRSDPNAQRSNLAPSRTMHSTHELLAFRHDELQPQRCDFKSHLMN